MQENVMQENMNTRNGSKGIGYMANGNTGTKMLGNGITEQIKIH